MDKSLQSFYNDKDTKENVYNYLIDYLEKETIKRVFERKGSEGIADAKEIIDMAFENLEVLFSPKENKKESVNQSR